MGSDEDQGLGGAWRFVTQLLYVFLCVCICYIDKLYIYIYAYTYAKDPYVSIFPLYKKVMLEEGNLDRPGLDFLSNVVILGKVSSCFLIYKFEVIAYSS